MIARATPLGFAVGVFTVASPLVSIAAAPAVVDVPTAVMEIPGERMTEVPALPVDELLETSDDCSFVDPTSSHRLALEPDDEVGWSAVMSDPSGRWHGDGSGALVWLDRVTSPGGDSFQATTEAMTVIEGTGNSLIVLMSRTSYPNDGPSDGITVTCPVQFGFPAEMQSFVASQPGPGAVIPDLTDVTTNTTDTQVTISGTTSAPPGTYVEFRVDASGLDGESSERATGVVDEFGRFGLGVPVAAGGIDCFSSLSIDGWVTQTENLDCPVGAPPTPTTTSSVEIGGSIFEVTTPVTVTSGGRMPFTVCGSQDGAPLALQLGFLSVGNDPAGELATHSTGLFGSDGCYSGAVMIFEPPGPVSIFTSDGPTASQVAEIQVTSPLVVDLPDLPATEIGPDGGATTDDDASTDDGGATTDDATNAGDAATNAGDAATIDDAADAGEATTDDATNAGDAATDDGDAATSDDAADAGDDGGFPLWIPAIVLGGIVLGGGFWLFRSRLGGRSRTGSTPDDLSMDDLEQYVDRDLGTTTDVYTGTTIASGGPVLAGHQDLDDRWIALLDEEARIQQVYMDDFRSLLEEVARSYQQYRDAIGIFHEKFLKVASGSTELQGYLQRWKDNEQTAQKQDIAFGIITVVWGVGRLGVNGARWLVGRTAVEEGAEGGARAAQISGAADEVATADTLMGGAATVIDDGRVMSDLSRRLSDKYLAEIGMTWDDWVRVNKYDLDRATTTLLQAVARSRGWITMTDEAAELIHRVLINGRLAAVGRGPGVDPADVAQLAEWASKGGFWDKLLLACVEMDEEIALLFAADDVKFLKALLASDGDLATLRHLLGPAQETALTVAAQAVSDVPSLSGLGFSGGKVVFDSANLGHDVAAYRDTAANVDHLDLGSYTDQFDNWASSWNEGIGWFMLDNLWGMFTSPFGWFSGILHTAAAMDRYTEFLEGSRDDLLELGSSLGAAIDALRDLHGAIDRADLDDPTSSLGGARAAELRDVLSALDDLSGSASEEWQAEHRAELDARRSHIEQKISQTEATLGSLHQQLELLASVADQLDAARRDDDGSLLPVVDLWNPGILVGLGSIDLMLRSLIGTALFGASQPLVATTDDSPAGPDAFEGTDDLVAGDPASIEWNPELDAVFVRPR